jgi:PleD family two-component response regulator
MVSIGLVVEESAHANIESLHQKADAALYKAKTSGRNRICLAGSSSAD